MAWDIGLATLLGSKLIRDQETIPMGMFISADGINMYVVGNQADELNQYDLSQEPWDVRTASFVRVLSITARNTYPRAISFKADGTKMYILDGSTDYVNEYNLSTIWDISTSAYLQQYRILEDASPEGMCIRSDGAKMYISGVSGDNIYEYDLTTPWDITSSVYSGQFSVSSEDTSPSGVCMSTDGSKMYMVGETGNDINQYDLVVPWDITTSSLIQTFPLSEVGPETMFFHPDGNIMYVLGSSGDNVLMYDIPTQKPRIIK